MCPSSRNKIYFLPNMKLMEANYRVKNFSLKENKLWHSKKFKLTMVTSFSN